MTRETEAVLLLTVPFGESGAGSTKPLTPTEWGEFAKWLKDRRLNPGDLLEGDPAVPLEPWTHFKVTVPRIQALLNRGQALGIALEKWERAGLWMVTRGDADYPNLLKQRLRQKAPAILFGCGERALLNAKGIAVVGSRDASEEDLRFAERSGRRAAECGKLIVSGGAKGVDSAAMSGALNAEGAAIGVLATNLLRATTSTKYRRSLMSGDLALVSPFNPEAGFHSGNLMVRNKYIYCLARAAIVVSSVPDEGGTWQGAVENLRNRWAPLLVKPTEATGSGNPGLVDRGGRWLEGLEDSAFGAHSQDASPVQGSGGGHDATNNPCGGGQAELPIPASPSINTPRQVPLVAEQTNAHSPDIGKQPKPVNAAPAEELYEKVRQLVVELCVEPKPAKAIAEALDVGQKQALLWIGRLVQECALRKATNPVRYVVEDEGLFREP